MKAVLKLGKSQLKIERRTVRLDGRHGAAAHATEPILFGHSCATLWTRPGYDGSSGNWAGRRGGSARSTTIATKIGALLEFPHTLAESFTDVAQLSWPENDQDDGQDDQQMAGLQRAEAHK